MLGLLVLTLILSSTSLVRELVMHSQEHMQPALSMVIQDRLREQHLHA